MRAAAYMYKDVSTLVFQQYLTNDIDNSLLEVRTLASDVMSMCACPRQVTFQCENR